MMSTSTQFPVDGIMPRKETQALQFIEAQPEYDGRGVRVAIFDTGVDPGAPGLERTTTGDVKVVGLVDASGSGDVAMDDQVDVREEGGKRVVNGPDGEEWEIPADWPIPSGKLRTGTKRLYSMIARGLRSRLQAKAKERFHRNIDKALIETNEELSKCDGTSQQAKQMKSDLEERLKQLAAIKSKFSDDGPMLNCVVFHDGTDFRGAVSVTRSFIDAPALSDYHKCLKYGTLRGPATETHNDEHLYMLNYGVNIYEDGEILSFVVDAGSHGTHVAGIVAGHYPKAPELNGVAPGAQIISVKIGDSRLGSMETGQSLSRAMKLVVDLKGDMINMSYGEPASHATNGGIMKLYSKLIHEHNIVFVTSAGNDGPALSTVGAPGSADGMITVGAYVSPEMFKAQYAQPSSVPEMPYTWTSRGPMMDGAMVTIGAPGGAICSIPNWNISKNTQMNGTSMSSPNACGTIALLVSALKAKDISYSPSFIERVIQNTAKSIPDHDAFGFGSGVIQVSDAFELMTKLTADQSVRARLLRHQVRLRVSIPSRDGARGIYIREAGEVNRGLQSIQVRVGVESLGTPEQRALLPPDLIDFEIPVLLRVVQATNAGSNESPAGMVVRVPSHTMLNAAGASFVADVDCTAVPPGAVAYQIEGYDSENMEHGPLFRVPVTIVHPEIVPPTMTGVVSLASGVMNRSFYQVPAGATFAEVAITPQNLVHPTTFVWHALQLLTEERYSNTESKHWVRLGPDSQPFKTIMPLYGTNTLEVVFGQYWTSSAYHVQCQVEVKFRGLTPDTRCLSFASGDTYAQVNVTACTRQIEKCQPAASLEYLRKSLSPTSSTVDPLPADRQEFPDGSRTHQLLLTYSFKAEEASEITVRLPTNDTLYESHFLGQLVMVHDDSNRTLGLSDAEPSAVKLPRAGSYTIRCQLLHHDSVLLNKLKGLPAQVDIKLGSAISLPVHATRDSLLGKTFESSFSSTNVYAGTTIPVFVAVCDSSKYPSQAQVGDELVGTIQYGPASTKADDIPYRSKKGFPLALCLTNLGKAPTPSPSDRRDRAQKHTDAVADLQVKFLQSHPVKTKEQYEEYKTHLKAILPTLNEARTLQVHVSHFEQMVKLGEDAHTTPESIGVELMTLISPDQLAAYFGVRHEDDETLQFLETKNKMEASKKALLAVLKHRVLSACKEVAASQSSEFEALNGAWKELKKWCDVEKDAIIPYARYHLVKGMYGKTLKVLLGALHGGKALPGTKSEVLRLVADACAKAGWSGIAEYYEQLNRARVRSKPGRF